MTIAASTPDAGRPNHRLKGILFLCFGASIFSLQDVVVKSVSGGYPVAEVLTIRCIVAYLPLFAMLAYDGGFRALRTARMGWMILRAVFLFLAYTTYYLALAALPMSTATALFFSAPLFIVALSGPLLKEHAGLGRWLAVLVGFGGALIVSRPGAETFEPAALFSLASAACYGIAQIMSRMLGPTATTSVMALYQNTVNIFCAAAVGLLLGHGGYAGAAHPSLEFLLRAWTMPTTTDLLLIAATGLIAAAGSWSLTHAYRVAEVNVVAPFEYSSIILALFWDLVIWQVLPSPYTLGGVTLIIAAGIYVLRSAKASGG
jgi:drug/metabolite transporter (DMT)-like permease